MVKICTKCKKEKQTEEFPPNKNQCKKCKVQYALKWQKEHPERANKATRKWDSENKDKRIPQIIAWQKEHPENVKATQRKRKAIKKGVTATLTTEEEKEIWIEFEGLCFWCGYIATHLDHIVPLTPKKGGLQGHHVKGNVVPSCQPCNNRKYNKDPLKFLFEERGLL